MQPKRNEATQARVDAADTAGIAKAKAQTAEMTLVSFHALCTAAGVQEIALRNRTIRLRGHLDGRNVFVEKIVPEGEPMPLYAMMAYYQFAAGMGSMQIEDSDLAAAQGLYAEDPILDQRHDFKASRHEIVQKVLVQAKRAAMVDITKPTPAGAGQRRPLSLPLCIECKTQPAMSASAEFCGVECARKHFTTNAKR